MVNIALISAWHVHFAQYADALAARGDCKLTVLWDDDTARGAQMAAKYGCDFEADYDALLARPDVDALMVTSSTNLHTDLLTKAARAGKHIFTEKVLCFTKEEAGQVRDAVKKSGVKFCISFPWRCRSEYLYIKDLVTSGTLGTISYARVRNAHNGASAGWLPPHFYDPALCGGGAMMDLGAHPMYLLMDLFGLPESVTSVFTNLTGKPVEDNAVSLLRYGGMVASSETGFVSQGDPFRMEVTGSKGTVRWDEGSGKVCVNLGEGFTEPERLPNSLKMPLDQWVDAIETGSAIEFTIDDAVGLTCMMESAYRSNRAGGEVKL